MERGYALVREQLFFQKELIERVSWFIRLRWVAAGAAIVGSWAVHLLEPKFPVLAINIIAILIFLYNAAFLRVWRGLKSRDPHEAGPFTVFAHTQMTLDLIALYCMIYFSGGIYSPLLMFVIFHVILAGILLSPRSCFLYGLFIIGATGALIVLEKSTLLPPQPILFQNPSFPHLLPLSRASFDMLALFIFFAAAILITAFLTTSIKLSLRIKGRDLLLVSKELDTSNAKLKALYEMVKKMGLCSQLQELMDLATRNAASMMGVKGASIKLLNEQKKKLVFASTYGLSENYVAKGAVDVERSLINRKIIEGLCFTRGEIHEEEYFQYPEDIRKEGIASMVCLPLRVEKMVLGVFCVYSDVTNYFGRTDIEFFSLMADLTALSIESLRSDLNKTWFLQKAAHQIRSPFTAIYSMLKVLRKGYLGQVNEKQTETIKRCEKRLEMLGVLINDLLKLGIKRTEAEKKVIQPVDGRKIMQGLSSLFQAHAREKGVDFAVDMDESLPQIMGDEELYDELFTNLISNAIKYTPGGGKVRVTLAKGDHRRVRFEVSDTGIGIPEEEMPRLFSEFFRAENAKTFAEEGTGLGLVIVKEILDFLGGSISVRSNVGEGTTFTCLLPAV
ncbi:MAG: GAF domain-containing sensor histidine kinase [Desulfobacterales bacterium]|nr:GAF domain-containing sensor histidine kinase [Desulfobacterales bacterium]